MKPERLSQRVSNKAMQCAKRKARKLGMSRSAYIEKLILDNCGQEGNIERAEIKS